jgi:alcohol dehydrogenase, propanol-preferring
MATMPALRMIAWQQPPQIQHVPIPEPGPGQVRIKVGGAGLCHSDLHIMHVPADAAPFPLPFTLGHENAGWIDKLGEGATGFAVGDPVIVYGPWGCGTCANCRQGMDNYCENGGGTTSGGGLGRDGGMAPYMMVPSTRALVPLGNLDPRNVAPLTDAALTSYHAIKRSLHLIGPGAVAVVIGIGGLGQMAVQILKAVSGATTVIAIDSAVDKRAAAVAMGADEALEPGDAAVARVKALTRGLGAQLVLDVVGADATLALAAKLARSMGALTIVGLGGGVLPVNFYTVPHECSVCAPYWGSVSELIEVVALAQAGKIKMVTEHFPLDRALEAYDRLEHGKVAGRAVVTPNG